MYIYIALIPNPAPARHFHLARHGDPPFSPDRHVGLYTILL